MRVIILFILVIIILTLTVWVWNVNPSRLEYFSIKNQEFKREQIEKIRNTTDLKLLKEEVIGQLSRFDAQAMDREQATLKVQTILAFIILLTFTTLIIAFLEIAARGKNYRQHNA